MWLMTKHPHGNTNHAEGGDWQKGLLGPSAAPSQPETSKGGASLTAEHYPASLKDCGDAPSAAQGTSANTRMNITDAVNVAQGTSAADPQGQMLIYYYGGQCKICGRDVSAYSGHYCMGPAPREASDREWAKDIYRELAKHIEHHECHCATMKECYEKRLAILASAYCRGQ